MPRAVREWSEEGWYHVYARGNRRQVVFRDDDDRAWFMRRLVAVERAMNLVHVAHCLMPNHVHLVVGPGSAGVSKLMHRVHGAYALWFNRRHGTVGHLFQGRFGSRLIDSEEDLVSLVRYVHRNPVAAGLVRRAEAWEWSSHADYLKERPPEHVRRGFRMVMRAMGGNNVASRQHFRNLVASANNAELEARSRAATNHDAGSGRRPAAPSGQSFSGERPTLSDIAGLVENHHGVPAGTIAGRRRDGKTRAARKVFCRLAIDGLAFKVTEVAEFLDRAPSTVSVLIRGSSLACAETVASSAPVPLQLEVAERR